MNNIVFIELPVSNKARYICQITEKYFTSGQRILVYVKDENDAKSLDKTLWTWKEDSFIPHVFSNKPEQFPYDPVLISNQLSRESSFSTLILNDPLPFDICKEFENVIDFAEVYDTGKRQQSRERFKILKETTDSNLSFQKLDSFLHQKEN